MSFLFPSAILLVPCIGIAVWSKDFFILVTIGFGLLLVPRGGGGGGAGKDGGEGSGTREVEAASGQGMASSGSGNKAEGSLFGGGAKGGKAIWDAVVLCDTR